jgi:hypothetical protein
MAITDTELDNIDDTIAENAARGARGVSSGDKRVDFLDGNQLLDLKRRLAEEQNGGTYDVAFEPKGYF